MAHLTPVDAPGVSVTPERLESFYRQAGELGYSADEAAVLLSLWRAPDAKCSDVADAARAKLRQLSLRISELERMRDGLEVLLGRCEGEGAAAACRLIDELSSSCCEP